MCQIYARLYIQPSSRIFLTLLPGKTAPYRASGAPYDSAQHWHHNPANHFHTLPELYGARQPITGALFAQANLFLA
jgi:hypothetical protein